MNPERPNFQRLLAAKAEVLTIRAPVPSQRAAPRWHHPDDLVPREAWRRVLAAHVQPLPDTLD